MTDRPSDRELLRRVIEAVAETEERGGVIPLSLVAVVADRLAEPEEPTLRSLVGAVPDLTGGVESVTYLRMKREIAELRADRDALVRAAACAVALYDAGFGTPGNFDLDGIGRARAVLARREKEGA